MGLEESSGHCCGFGQLSKHYQHCLYLAKCFPNNCKKLVFWYSSIISSYGITCRSCLETMISLLHSKVDQTTPSNFEKIVTFYEMLWLKYETQLDGHTFRYFGAPGFFNCPFFIDQLRLGLHQENFVCVYGLIDSWKKYSIFVYMRVPVSPIVCSR